MKVVAIIVILLCLALWMYLAVKEYKEVYHRGRRRDEALIAYFETATEDLRRNWERYGKPSPVKEDVEV